MTNYNDGKWHGWNGGECPVHPKTVVEAARASGVVELEARAFQDSNWLEAGRSYSIVAFRVIKEHKEPREIWTYFDKHEMRWSYSNDKDFAESRHKVSGMVSDMVHYREVLE